MQALRRHLTALRLHPQPCLLHRIPATAPSHPAPVSPFGVPRSPPEPPGPRTCPPRSVVVSLRIVAPACTLDRLKTPYQTPPCPNKKTGGSLALTPGLLIWAGWCLV